MACQTGTKDSQDYRYDSECETIGALILLVDMIIFSRYAIYSFFFHRIRIYAGGDRYEMIVSLLKIFF